MQVAGEREAARERRRKRIDASAEKRPAKGTSELENRGNSGGERHRAPRELPDRY